MQPEFPPSPHAPSRRTPSRHVLMLHNARYSSARDKLRGAMRYASERGWDVRVASDDQKERLESLLRDGWPDGILLLGSYEGDWRFEGPAIVVDWGSAQQPQLPGAAFLVCETAAGLRCLAKTLLQSGYRRFVWSVFPDGIDPAGMDWPAARWRLLRGALRAHGEELETAPTLDGLSPSVGDLRALRVFLRSLGPDTIMIAANDGWASLVLRLAVEWKLAPPRHFSLLGFDNDRDICESVAPTLSSVDLRFEEAGRMGARALESMMDGGAKAPQPGMMLKGPAPSLVARGSTRRTGPSAPSLRVSDALAYLRRHAFEPISAADVAEYMGCSRQRAGALFRAETGESIARHLADERINALCNMLSDGKMSIADICRLAPFTEESYVHTFFRRETGLTMGEWRRGRRKT